MTSEDLIVGLKYKTEWMQHFLKGIGITNADNKSYEQLKEIIKESQPESNIWYYIGEERWDKLDSTSLSTTRVLSHQEGMQRLVFHTIIKGSLVITNPEFLIKHDLKYTPCEITDKGYLEAIKAQEYKEDFDLENEILI